MPQLSLYLDDATMSLLRQSAEEAQLSLSKYVAGLIRQDSEGSAWPEGYFDQVCGRLTDPSFTVAEEPSAPLDDIVLFA
ncbi:antitoxin [Eggerthellaceae bacterium zg-887]|uniref:antitoxin n=1 Tax=Xiamenia xianingshaonis TaxID=2682776 RepID=UPI001408469F|nr:antitoxin [Xiamenia xianingshaonis]NHM15065.1 antitoxin [Xiamenia xianingshaonis]